MKKKLLNNFGFKILSVICAIVLWVVVMNISDSQITVRIEEVPVEIINGDVLDQLDKVYDIQKGNTVDIIVKGKRSIVEKLSAKDFVATADLKDMSITNSVPIMVETAHINISKDITITCIDNTMVLSLEEKITKQLPIKVKALGKAKEGFAVGEMVTTPNIITVEGPESAVNKVVDAVAEINVSGATTDCESTCNVALFDAYGEAISNDRISVNQNEVNTSVKIYPVKEVPVLVDIKGNPANGYAIGDTVYEPKTVKIAGTREQLNSIKNITIDSLSVAGLAENYETTIGIGEYLPEGIVLAQGNTDVVVSVTIEKLIEKKIPVNATDIELKNTSEDYEYKINLPENCEICASGLEDVVNDLDISSFSPYIECADFQVGDNYNVTVVLNEKEGITSKLNGEVSLSVSKKE